MNTNKGEHQDVLDPFSLPTALFTLNLLSGRVQVNATIAAPGSMLHDDATQTVRRLKLNSGEYRELRLVYIDEYLLACQSSASNAKQNALEALLLKSPFIHNEVVRQGWAGQ